MDNPKFCPLTLETKTNEEKLPKILEIDLTDSPKRNHPVALNNNCVISNDTTSCTNEATKTNTPNTNVPSTASTKQAITTVRQFTGDEYALLRNKIAQKRKVVNGVSKSMGDFFTLSAGAQLLLKGRPVMRSNPKELVKKPEIKVSAPPKQEESSKAKRQKKGPPKELFCMVCNVQLTSEEVFIIHNQGKKHRKKLAALTGHISPDMLQDRLELKQMKVDQVIPKRLSVKKDAVPKIQIHLDRADAPLIGLDHVIEIWTLNENQDPIYVCELCNSVCQMVTIISHIAGFKHRLNCLKYMKPTAYEEIKGQDLKKSELSRLCELAAEKFEEEEGRGTVVVEQEEQQPSTSDAISISPQEESVIRPYPYSVEEICHLPSHVRMNMIRELAKLTVDEIMSSSIAYRLNFVVHHLRQLLNRFHGNLNRYDEPNNSQNWSSASSSGTHFQPESVNESGTWRYISS